MLKLIRSLLLFVPLLTSCTGKHQSGTGKDERDSLILYPYAPVYTTAFDKGDPFKSETVLKVWKQYETGDVSHAAAAFADSLTFIFPDTILTGERAAVLRSVQQRRSAYVSMQSYVDAWMPVRAKQPDEELVLLWGRQDGTTKYGKRDYRVVYETWRFNKEGKIQSIEQYLTHPH